MANHNYGSGHAPVDEYEYHRDAYVNRAAFFAALSQRIGRAAKEARDVSEATATYEFDLTCKYCRGEGIVDTGIGYEPWAICDVCGGTGLGRAGSEVRDADA